MISLTPYLRSGNNRVPAHPGDDSSRRAEALNRVISVLMQGIALHGLRYDETAFHKFQNAAWKMRADFDQATDEDSAMLLAGAVIRLLEEHNDAAQAHLKARQNELGGIVGLLCETLLDVTHANPHTTGQLRGMEQEIVRANSVSAFGAVKTRLDTCMSELRAKAQLPVAHLQPEHAKAGETDPITGLPDAGCAIEALAGIWSGRPDHYLALFGLEYLETINLRFGFRTGDELLALLSQHLGDHIKAPDQLFRWRGPCLAALVERQAPESFVSAELGRAIPARLESATIVREREAMVRVSTCWEMIRLEDATTLDEVIARMNEFGGNRSRYVRQVSAGA